MEKRIELDPQIIELIVTLIVALLKAFGILKTEQ